MLWRLSQRDYNLLSPILWVIVILLIVMAMWRWDRLNGRVLSLAPLLDRRDAYAILAILAVGFVINAYQITNVPNIMMGDEGDWFTTARAVAVGDYNPPWFGFGVYSFSGVQFDLYGLGDENFWRVVVGLAIRFGVCRRADGDTVVCLGARDVQSSGGDCR